TARGPAWQAAVTLVRRQRRGRHVLDDHGRSRGCGASAGQAVAENGSATLAAVDGHAVERAIVRDQRVREIASVHRPEHSPVAAVWIEPDNSLANQRVELAVGPLRQPAGLQRQGGIDNHLVAAAVAAEFVDDARALAAGRRRAVEHPAAAWDRSIVGSISVERPALEGADDAVITAVLTDLEQRVVRHTVKAPVAAIDVRAHTPGFWPLTLGLTEDGEVAAVRLQMEQVGRRHVDVAGHAVERSILIDGRKDGVAAVAVSGESMNDRIARSICRHAK